MRLRFLLVQQPYHRVIAGAVRDVGRVVAYDRDAQVRVRLEAERQYGDEYEEHGDAGNDLEKADRAHALSSTPIGHTLFRADSTSDFIVAARARADETLN